MMLPSRKVLSFFIVTAALVVSIIIAYGRDKTSAALEFTNSIVAGEKVHIPENPNWQNDLGQVGAKIDYAKLASSTKAEEESVTDTFSRTFMSNYLGLKESGNLNQQTAQDLIDKTINYVDKSDVRVVTASELTILPDNGKETIASYGENLGTILKQNKPNVVKNEIDIINQALSTKNYSKLSELDPIITTYQNLAKSLFRMSVPQKFVKAHLDILNGAIKTAVSLKQIKTVLGDPVTGLSYLKNYQEGATAYKNAIKATSKFISANGVIYKQGSGGYYLLYGI